MTFDIESQLEPLLRRIVREELAALAKEDTTPLTDHQVAKRLGRSVSTVRRMKADGRINSASLPSGRATRS